MKKIRFLFLVLFIVLFSGQASLCASTNFTVELPSYKLAVNDEPVEASETLNVISVNKVLYVPVTEVAVFFGFHAEIDKNNPNIINFAPENNGEADAKQKEMMKIIQDKNKVIKETKHEIYCQGKPMKAHLLDINGASFVKLEDAVKFFGIYMYIDNEKKIINITEMSKEEKKGYEEYLSSNAVPIDFKNGMSQDFTKTTGLDQYSIYLIGENHAIAKNFEIQLFFIKYLSQNQNVKYILWENGYCDAQLLNKYLESGDENILKNLMQNLKGTFACSKEMDAFYKAVYDYNKALPQDKKLKFIGVDIQHQTNTGTDYLISLLPQKEVPVSIKKNIDVLKLAKEKNAYKIETFEALLKDFEVNKTAYQEYLGQDYEHFKFGLTNIIQRFECKKGSEDDFMRLREKMMIENFVNQYSKLNNAKCLGIFGGAHTSLSTYLDQEKSECNLATYMDKKYEMTKGKVASIMSVYFNSYYMDSQTGKSEKVYAGILQKLLAGAAKSDYTLFPIDREPSIFKEDGSTASQQYLLLIKDSNAAAPYDSK